MAWTPLDSNSHTNLWEHINNAVAAAIGTDGWKALTVDTTSYTVTQACQYRIVGELVEVVGRVQPKTATAVAGYMPTVASLPAEARPSSIRMAGHLAYTGGAGIPVEVYADPTGPLVIRTGGAIPTTADIPINLVYGRG